MPHRDLQQVMSVSLSIRRRQVWRVRQTALVLIRVLDGKQTLIHVSYQPNTEVGYQQRSNLERTRPHWADLQLTEDAVSEGTIFLAHPCAHLLLAFLML